MCFLVFPNLFDGGHCELRRGRTTGALSSANLAHTGAAHDTDAHGFRVELKKEKNKKLPQINTVSKVTRP